MYVLYICDLLNIQSIWQTDGSTGCTYVCVYVCVAMYVYIYLLYYIIPSTQHKSLSLPLCVST